MTAVNEFIAIDEALIVDAHGDMVDNYVRFQVSRETMLAIKSFHHHRVELAVRQVDESMQNGRAVVRAEQIENEYVIALIQHGVFTKNIEVLRAIGSDGEYQAYCRQLPCDISGGYEECLHGDGRSVYAHVSDASRPTSGKKGQGSNKPLYSGIPMAQRLHQHQHNEGWIWLFRYQATNRGVTKSEQAEQLRKYRSVMNWAKSLRDKRLNQWCLDRLTEKLGADINQMLPAQIMEWADSNGVLEYFPLTMERSILQSSAIHRAIAALREKMEPGTEARMTIAKSLGWPSKSVAVRNAYDELWIDCENPACSNKFAPPTPLNKPYTRRFCSADCVAESGNRTHSTKSNQVGDNEALMRFLYGQR